MGLNKNLEDRIVHLFKKAVEVGNRRGKEVDAYKKTERVLRAYPVLKENIRRYELDIEDIKIEDMRNSKDFVLFLANSGGAPAAELEEIRKAKILVVNQKIVRDQKKIDEIDSALDMVRDDEYFKIIEMNYFDGMKQNEISEILHCDKATVYRNKKRLIEIMSVSLFGADAVQ